MKIKTYQEMQDGDLISIITSVDDNGLHPSRDRLNLFHQSESKFTIDSSSSNKAKKIKLNKTRASATCRPSILVRRFHPLVRQLNRIIKINPFSNTSWSPFFRILERLSADADRVLVLSVQMSTVRMFYQKEKKRRER